MDDVKKLMRGDVFIDGRGVFPVVCLSNIRTGAQQSAFFINVINGDFRWHDYNADKRLRLRYRQKGSGLYF